MAAKRILIASASVGAGHLRAAEAVAAGLAMKGLDIHVENRDVLQFTTAAFHKLYRDSYLELVGRSPEIFGWLYQATDQPFRRRRVQAGIEEANARKFLKFIREFDPDLAICTHFLPITLIRHELRKGRARCKIATVVTDFDVHGLWLGRPSDHYFVAGEEAFAHLRAIGIPPESVTISGIPTHPIFSKRKDRAEMRRKHGLHPDHKAILLSTGGFGVGNAGQILEALLTVKTPLQVVAVCGKNAQLKAQMEQIVANRPADSNSQVKVLGFTNEMDELMSASDLMMGKPGGLTTWESLNYGLVWAVVNPIPGQEERNTIHLLEEGAAIWCNNVHTMAFKLEKLLNDEARLRTMSANSLRLARPDACTVIVERCLRMLEPA